MEREHSRRASRGWPTVEEQLADAGAIPGSALERLIRENQELDMLRPEEAEDRLSLPPWLRVYWRKQHPDADYSGPSGGYPLLLEELGEWMIRHQDLAPDDEGSEDPGPEGH